jgi:hypothetical protein
VRNLEREDRRGLPRRSPPRSSAGKIRRTSTPITCSKSSARRASTSSRAGAAHERARRRDRPGYTPVGGDILFIEATRMPGKGAITLTGQIGDVMKESAMAAFSYVARAPASSASTEAARQQRHPHPRPRRRDPEGRPSAGVAMFTALARCSRTARCATTSP